MTTRRIDMNSAIRRGLAPNSLSSTVIPLHHKVDGEEYTLSHLSHLTVGDVKSRFNFADFEFLESPHALSLQVRGRPVNREKVTREWDHETVQAVVAHYVEALLQRYGLQGYAHTNRVEFIIDEDQRSPWTY